MAATAKQSNRQAIAVKVLPATTHRPTRLRATCRAGSLTESYDYENMTEQAAALAAKLADKYDWGGHWAGADTGNGWVFVNVS